MFNQLQLESGNFACSKFNYYTFSRGRSGEVGVNCFQFAEVNVNCSKFAEVNKNCSKVAKMGVKLF